jgi:hypothetical protein
MSCGDDHLVYGSQQQLFTLTQGQWYRLTMTIASDRPGSISVGFRSNPGTSLFEAGRVFYGTTEQQVTLIFKSPVTTSANAAMLVFTSPLAMNDVGSQDITFDGHHYLDNVELVAGDVIYLDPTDQHILLANPTDASASIALPSGTWYDVTGVSHTSSITVAAWYSVPLYRAASASGLISVAAKTLLAGPYNETSGLMLDSLRSQHLIPLTEPYTAQGFVQPSGGGEVVDPQVLLLKGPDAIVDWVRLELRSSGSPGTVVAARQALVQRDGDIVDVNGQAPVVFTVANGSYYLAVRHRNHLGAMSASALSFASGTTAVFDLPASGTSLYGTNAVRTFSNGMRGLWAGNTVDGGGGIVKYIGSDNDRDPILGAVGGSVPTWTLSGQYRREDVNMDAVVKYTGAANDRDPVLLTVGGSVPTATRPEQLP